MIRNRDRKTDVDYMTLDAQEKEKQFKRKQPGRPLGGPSDKAKGERHKRKKLRLKQEIVEAKEAGPIEDSYGMS